MDLLSHGLIGAAAGLAVSPRAEARAAAGAAFAAALLPDVDALIRSADDPLMVLQWHRHFTHALIFVPLGALIAALLLRPVLGRRLAWPRLYLCAFLGYGLAVLLDACTSYGTHLLWPFSDARISWSIISVLDPAFTALVAAPVAVGLARRVPAAGGVALTLAAGYLLVGWAQHHRALSAAEAIAAEQNIAAESVAVKPAIGNLVLWRAMIANADRVRVDAVRVGLFGATRVYAGESGQRVDAAAVPGAPPSTTAGRDVARFAYFSEDLLVRHAEDPHLIGDARYAMLPNSLAPIWAIRVDPNRPERHVELEVDRTMTARHRACFLDMLLGRDTHERACARSVGTPP